ncbi:hypothetical protein EDC01DRAFT_610571 [Geopyxis carbonaria]|nr:hypothetical protein EDC01DRAFT_610571 [Geopyxis carbonaria]
MSLTFRRGLSTIIPPKIASPSVYRSCQGCYQNGPRCRILQQAPPRCETDWPCGKIPGKALWKESERYAYVYHSNLGYAQNYYFHLRHHKNNAH